MSSLRGGEEGPAEARGDKLLAPVSHSLSRPSLRYRRSERRHVARICMKPKWTMSNDNRGRGPPLHSCIGHHTDTLP